MESGLPQAHHRVTAPSPCAGLQDRSRLGGTDPCPAPSSAVPTPAPAHSTRHTAHSTWRVPLRTAPATLSGTERPDVLRRLFGQHHSLAGGKLWSNNAAHRKWFTTFLQTFQAIFVRQQIHHLILPYKVLIKLATKKHHFLFLTLKSYKWLF